MEAFESFVALTMEHEGLVVSEAVKFFVRRRTRQVVERYQSHGYEVDLVGASRERLVLATVKSFFGSTGVSANHVDGSSRDESWVSRYAFLNDVALRDRMLEEAASRYGYEINQIEVRLYAGKFMGKRGEHEARVRAWCAGQHVGAGPIKVYNVREVAEVARRVAESKTYRDNAALVAMKVLHAAGMLTPLPEV